MLGIALNALLQSSSRSSSGRKEIDQISKETEQQERAEEMTSRATQQKRDELINRSSKSST